MDTEIKLKVKPQKYYTPQDFENFYKIYTDERCFNKHLYLIEKLVIHLQQGLPKNMTLSLPNKNSKLHDLHAAVYYLNKLYYKHTSCPICFDLPSPPHPEVYEIVVTLFRSIVDFIKNNNTKIKIRHYDQDIQPKYNLFYYFYELAFKSN